MQNEVLLALSGVAGDVFVDDGTGFKVRSGLWVTAHDL